MSVIRVQAPLDDAVKKVYVQYHNDAPSEQPLILGSVLTEIIASLLFRVLRECLSSSPARINRQAKRMLANRWWDVVSSLRLSRLKRTALAHVAMQSGTDEHDEASHFIADHVVRSMLEAASRSNTTEISAAMASVAHMSQSQGGGFE